MKMLAVVRYVGTDFHGFQVQPAARTVQGELSDAFSRMLGVSVKVTGCSRTDAGVHADNFVLTLEGDALTLPPEKLPVAIAPYLPADLALISARACPEGFHPRYDVVSKEYLYRVYNQRVADPFLKDRVWFLSRPLPTGAVGAMREAAAFLCGRHDFSSFMAQGSDTEDTVRTVYGVSIAEEDGQIVFRIRADGFLYHMVRIIVGTLIEIGFGRFSPEDVKTMIEARNRDLSGMTAPAEGLYLHAVTYPDFAFD